MSTSPVRRTIKAGDLLSLSALSFGSIEGIEGVNGFLTYVERLSTDSDTIIVHFDRVQIWCKPEHRFMIFD